MKKSCFVFIMMLSAMLIATSVFSQTQKELEEFAKKQQQGIDALKQSQDDEMLRMQKEYEDYVKAEKAAYAAFKKDVENTWGKGNAAESTNKDWVEYSADKKSRSIVDFESGKATVEVILTDQQAANPQVVEQVVENQVETLLQSKGTTKDYDTKYEKREPLSTKPVLMGQVTTPDGKKIEQLPLTKAVKEIVEAAKPQVKTIKGDDGSVRKVAVFSLALAPDNIKTRAETYKDIVASYSNKYKIEPALVYALIQTESSFNPKAKSHVPAYGLMQIVPRYAGKDAYKFVYGNDMTPTSNYLYEPKNNIELGIAYMHMLINRSFGKVNDENCRMLCSIAAYNTGAGNVSRTFIKSTNLPKAIPEINKYSYDELYNYMYAKLPAQETRNYIKKVTERMAQYKNWIQ
ncbi:MAG: murein transglycosylase domain-containing protein [Culturomica sp.]|jgi:membrane-bound lytic murein transglycosylase C|nr:murein transglycosylase domain-containing protein [Culturomica sp.]